MNDTRNEVGATIFAAAVRLSRKDATSNKWRERYTLKSAGEVLGKRRTPKRYTRRDAIYNVRVVAERIVDARNNSHRQHRDGVDPLAVPLADRPLRKRLAKRVTARASGLMDHVLRSYARQSDPVITPGCSFAAASASLTKETGWIDYKRDGNRQGIVDAFYSVTLGRGWLALPAWVQTCDGMLTLAAIRLDADERDGETIYRAKWARNSRGGVETVTGFIVRQEHDGREYTAHGRTLGGARGTITKQLPEWAAAADERSRKMAERIERIKAQIVKRLDLGKLNGYADVSVTLGDSKRAGNCLDGTRHWIERYFPGRESATVAEVVEVEDQRERVLLACAAAVRRELPSVFADNN